MAKSLVKVLAEALAYMLAVSGMEMLAKILVKMLTESQVNMLAESLVNMLTESLVNMLAKSMTRRTHDQANLFPSDLTKRWPWWSCHWEQVDLAMGEYVDYVTAEQVGLASGEEVDLIFVCSWKFTRKKFVLFSFLNK